nr:hypothetical protein BaRGS_014958 [Batillaria attramentaria]
MGGWVFEEINVLFRYIRTKPPNQRLLLILMDGLRYDYLNQSALPLPGFRKIVERGAKPDALIPDFPTLSYPNYYSIMTGRG